LYVHEFGFRTVTGQFRTLQNSKSQCKTLQNCADCRVQSYAGEGETMHESAGQCRTLQDITGQNKRQCRKMQDNARQCRTMYMEPRKVFD
jgi:hypothetical protein